MKCPECDYRKAIVIKSLDLKGIVKRTRQCPKCNHKFNTTEETTEGENMLERIENMEKVIYDQK